MKTGIAFWIVIVISIIVVATIFEPATFMDDTSWMKALAIFFIHYFAPQIRPHLKKYESYIISFAGGMAVTYVFCQLLPEIDEGHAVVGELIYLFILLGFIIYYGLERYLRKLQKRNVKSIENYEFSLAFGGYWIYNFLIIFSIPDTLSVSHIHVLLMAFAMGLDLLHNDFEMGSKHPRLFDKWGRYLLAIATLAGYFCRFLQPDGEAFNDIMTAILAGSIIYSVFKNELPNPERTSVLWFSIGIIFYTFLLVLLLKGV